MEPNDLATSAVEERLLAGLDEEAALRSILEGTATVTGENFFRSLVDSLCNVLGVSSGLVTEYFPETNRARALAFRAGEKWIDDFEYDVAGTPCGICLQGAKYIHYPERVQEAHPNDQDLKDLNIHSYMGVPMLGKDEEVLGHLAVMDTRPMIEEPRGLAIFRIFAARALAEMRRLRAEKDVLEREMKLSRLVGSAMDAVIELDRELKITLLNDAARKTFVCEDAHAVGKPFAAFLSTESGDKLERLAKQLDARDGGESSMWVPEGLTAVDQWGGTFSAEATLSRYEIRRKPFYTLILRNVNDRLEAERRIETLTVQTEYLRAEIDSLQNFGNIVGKSRKLMAVLDDVKQVADTNATVLIYGETGAGKELIARAVHQASKREGKPLIKVNCAAIPAALMESEFFGHERGAFTGATDKREGRFALANGGTIFLDEVGELSLDLQAKLLRVLQEGEFEPVGSSKTQSVDVRIIAATNRDLQFAVEDGEFRQDLFYRLNVFPLQLPPLRERDDDVVILATEFVKGLAKRMGRTIAPLSDEHIRRLKAYDWPGNVRELQNVIERAVITARDGVLNLDRALPETEKVVAQPKAIVMESTEILTVAKLQEIERGNIIRALESVDWRVSGDSGAAKLLGMNPSTLSSRMKALGIQRPR